MFKDASYGGIVSNQNLPPFHPSMHPAGSGSLRDPDSSPAARAIRKTDSDSHKLVELVVQGVEFEDGEIKKAA